MTKTTRQYVADVKRRLGISSDYALAKALGITKQGAASLSSGRTAMNNTTAAKVAELLELEPMQVIADCELERGSSPELWKRIRDAAVVAALAFGAASFGLPPDASAATRGGVDITVSGYTLRTNRRRSSFEAFVAWILGR